MELSSIYQRYLKLKIFNINLHEWLEICQTRSSFASKSKHRVSTVFLIISGTILSQDTVFSVNRRCMHHEQIQFSRIPVIPLLDKLIWNLLDSHTAFLHSMRNSIFRRDRTGGETASFDLDRKIIELRACWIDPNSTNSRIK